jgi:hypothetical protein
VGRRTCFSFSPRPGARTRPGARSGPPLTEGGPREPVRSPRTVRERFDRRRAWRRRIGRRLAHAGEGGRTDSARPEEPYASTLPPWRRGQRDEGIRPHGLHAWYGALRAAWPSPTEFRGGRAPPHLCPEGRGLPSWAIRLAAPVHSRRHRSRAALSRQLGDFQKAAPHTRRVQAVGARRSLQNDARGSAR